MHYTIICVLIFFCFSLTNANLVPAVCKDITKADQENVSYGFCVSTLGSDPRSSKSTAAQLGGISFQLAISKAEVVLSAIQKVLQQPRNEQHDIYPLRLCLSFYSRIPDDMKEGLQALQSGDYKKANVKVSAVMTMASVCRDGIVNKTGGLALVKEKNSEFRQLNAIALGFTKLLPIIN